MFLKAMSFEKRHVAVLFATNSPNEVVYLGEAFAGNGQLNANAAQIFKTRGHQDLQNGID